MLTGQDLKSLQNTFTQQEEEFVEQDYLIEHLDYSYISQCQNVQELRKLEAVLDSGKEGEYPKLLEFTRSRISSLQPPKDEDEEESFSSLVNSLISQSSENSEISEISLQKNLDPKFDKDFSKISKFSTEKLKVFSKCDFYTRKTCSDREKEKGNECFKAGGIRKLIDRI